MAVEAATPQQDVAGRSGPDGFFRPIDHPNRTVRSKVNGEAGSQGPKAPQAPRFDSSAPQPPSKSPYYDSIRDRLARTGRIGMDPRHVEAYMRIEHPTLDGLSRDQFTREVEVSAQCVEAAGLEESEGVARSFGL